MINALKKNSFLWGQPLPQLLRPLNINNNLHWDLWLWFWAMNMFCLPRIHLDYLSEALHWNQAHGLEADLLICLVSSLSSHLWPPGSPYWLLTSDPTRMTVVCVLLSPIKTISCSNRGLTPCPIKRGRKRRELTSYKKFYLARTIKAVSLASSYKG